MKKNLALLLVVVLALTAVLGVAPIASAEEEAATKSQDIAYFNVSLKMGATILFAVPADGYTVNSDGTVDGLELLIFEGSRPSLFTYTQATSILEASGKTTINGKTYVVFSFSELSASQMTDTICARAVYTDSKGFRSYGEVYDYSVVEFANWYLNRTDPVQHAELVETMLVYGDAAAAYKPSANAASYKASDAKSLVTISVKRVLDGVDLDGTATVTQLATKGSTVTLTAPFVDGAVFESWSGADVTGGKITVSGDVELVANYSSRQFYFWDYEGETVGAKKNNATKDTANAHNFIKPDGSAYVPVCGGKANNYAVGSTSTVQRVPHEYCSFEMVEIDGNKCLRMGHTGAGELKLTQNGVTMGKTGIGNTVGFTFQADFKASADGTVPPSQFKIDRYESTSAPTIFGFDAESNVYVGDPTKGTRIGKLSADKFSTVTVVYNADTGMIDGYIDGVYGGSYTITDNDATRKALLAAINTDTHTRFQFTIYGGYLGGNWTTKGIPQEIIDSGALVFEETTEFEKLDGNSQIYVKSGDTYKWSKNAPKAGTQMYKVTSIDYEKYEAYFTQHESFYMDNASLTAGVHAPAAK